MWFLGALGGGPDMAAESFVVGLFVPSRPIISRGLQQGT